ncbi:hypothetical protein OOK31_38560 [Streptomyces sp. NBC_00249]|uniref:hypothetical protein n=1 Tax=Streptomyces sp. NBC_00249 TaxID=2975690 RepID=UPI00224D15B3|nr:hypothetical protein [Streptomyces sp. NBC_00249]MCX5199715.1 hypothetical protein [Streptomyces sp. NBC_00249]
METTAPTPDERAARGAEIVREHLAHAQPHDTPTARARRGWSIAHLHRPHTGRWTPVPCSMWQELITAAVTDVLHLADGWHSPETVLTRAFAIHWSQDLPAQWSDAANGGQGLTASGGAPRAPRPDTDPRDRDALAGAVADLYAAAADRYDGTAEELADQAETDFWDEAHAARLHAVRTARTAP